MLKKIRKIKLLKNLRLNKKAVSLMISYVILISIVIGLSIGVYGWLKLIANPSESINCKEGTSLILESELCALGRLELTLKNNGRFNIDGVIISIGEIEENQPTFYPIAEGFEGLSAGHYPFISVLKPQKSAIAYFTNKDKTGAIINNVNVIQLQPFILKNNQKIICQDAVIKQKVTDCSIG